MSENIEDFAGIDHWEMQWAQRNAFPVIDVRNPHIGAYLDRLFDRWYGESFKRFQGSRARLLEVGCAGSTWLPHFALEHGMEVEGVDFSLLGCLQAQAILKSRGVNGNIVCCDLFQPPDGLKDRYDVVLSLGVVEHFANPADVLRAISHFAKPDGLIITVLPNMSGTLGWAQWLIDPETYHIHVAHTLESIVVAHQEAGLRIESAEYFAPVNYSVLDMAYASKSGIGFRLRHSLRWLLAKASRVIWLLERSLGITFPRTRLFSPYIFVRSTPGERDLRVRPVVHAGQVPPLGLLNSRALELLQAIERDPVFVNPIRGLQVVTRTCLPERLAARKLALEEELRDFELRFETPHMVFGELLVNKSHPATIHIKSHVETPHRSHRGETNLPAGAPRFGVGAVDVAVALEIVVGDVELIANAELRRANRLGR